MVKRRMRKRPARHRRRSYVRKDGTRVGAAIINPDLIRTSKKDQLFFHKRVLRHLIPETIAEAIDKGDLIEEDYTKLELYKIAKENNLLDYKKKFNKLSKRGYINFIIEEEMARQEIFIEPKTEEQKRKKRYYPKYHARMKPELMEKELGIEIMDASRELAKEDREYAIGIDFENPLKDPQRFLAVRGEKRSCLKIDDVEIFGHTHPHRDYPDPSLNDLSLMVPYKPEFIVAGKTGKIIIIEIKNPTKYKKWMGMVDEKIKDNKNIQKGLVPLFSQNKEGSIKITFPDLGYSTVDRESFFQKTGIQIRDYKPNMKLKIPKDVYYEKGISTYYTKPKKIEKSSLKKEIEQGGVRLQVYESMTGKWKDHHKSALHNSITEAQIVGDKINKSIEKFNKKAERDLRPRAYGSISFSPMRVIDGDGNVYPGSNRDKKNFKSQYKYYKSGGYAF